LGGGDAGYLQQSFLRMKIAFSSRRKNPPMAGMKAVGALPRGAWLIGALLVVAWLFVAWLVVGLIDTGGYIINDRTNGGQPLGIFITDLDTEFFFEGHKSFEHVQGIQAQVIGKRGFGDQGGFFYPQLFVKNGPDPGRNLGFINNGVHNQ
jgi:hypothetical protein